MLRDRAEATQASAKRLAHVVGLKIIIVALQRGGVMFSVRRRSIFPELAIGTVVAGPCPATVLNVDTVVELGVPREFEKRCRWAAASRDGRSSLERLGHYSFDRPCEGELTQASAGLMQPG